MSRIICSLCFKKKQAKKSIFDPKIALRTEPFDPARNSYFTAHFSNVHFKCSRPLRNCGNIKLLYGRGQGEAQTRYSTDDRSELWHDSQPWQNRILLSLLSYDIPHVNMQKKFGKNGFHTLQGTMSHRPMTNTSSLKSLQLNGEPEEAFRARNFA